MPVVEKTRPTKEVKVTFGSGRSARVFALTSHQARKAEAFVSAQLKETKTEKTIPADQVLPELADDVLRPAAMLRGARNKAALTQKELAAKLEIHQHHLSEMEHGKRPIGKALAKRLAEVLETDYRLFL